MISRTLWLTGLLFACSDSATPAAMLATRDDTSSSPGVSAADRPIIPGGETSDFGDGEQPTCDPRTKTPIDVAEARQLGFPIDAQLELLSREFSMPLHWRTCDSPEPADTVMSLRLSLDQLILAENVPTHALSDGWRCPNHLIYRMLVDAGTEDGTLGGRFYVLLNDAYQGIVSSPAEAAIPVSPELCVSGARPDLRNFWGSAQFGVQLARPHWGHMGVQLCAGEGGSSGYFTPEIVYTDQGEPSVRSTYLATWPAPRESETCVAASHDPYPSVSLDEYPGSIELPTVPVTVLADADEPGVAVAIQVRVDGALTHDTTLPAAAMLDLGRLSAGAVVEAEVRNVSGAGFVRSQIILSDCHRTEAVCSETGCVARTSHSVAFHECRDE